jgi:hypothetical protein
MCACGLPPDQRRRPVSVGAAAPTISEADAESSPDETLLELKISRARLDESTELSDEVSASESAPSALTASERAAQKRKRRKPGVIDGRGRRTRGLLSMLGPDWVSLGYPHLLQMELRGQWREREGGRR